jgi:tripartite motif-containing protein 71
MYKNLQPKEESLTFIQPSFELIQEIRNQGEIVINCRNNMSFQQNPNSNGSNTAPVSAVNLVAHRQPLRSSNSPNNGEQLLWDSANGENGAAGGNGNGNGAAQVTQSKMTYASIVKPAAVISGQCIPGSNSHVSVKPALAPSEFLKVIPTFWFYLFWFFPGLTFCMDGHEDGEVSRPWGVCVNKCNDIIIADRRNNRIQVFFPDGTFKFKFGAKGTSNGQFDLPAGVATDQNNRIIVVDKDNHRIQVFSNTGVFILKFGSYGKELSQFMYPWACAVNIKSQILVTDSRNHRIQLFSPDGHFISRFSFDGLNHSRYLKGLTTPRGVAFTPQGNIIISDFENHRLILIDSSMTKVRNIKLFVLILLLMKTISDFGHSRSRRVRFARVLPSLRHLLR